MSLESLIAVGQYQTAQEAYDAITTASVEVIDEQLYTWAGVALLVGPVGAESLRLALDANGMGWVVHQLGGSGIQLSNSLVQQALLGFAQANVPGCDVLAAKGRSLVAPWKSDGLGQAPTLQEVTAEFEQWQARQNIQSIRSRLDAAFNQIGTSEQVEAIAELRALADELEG